MTNTEMRMIPHSDELTEDDLENVVGGYIAPLGTQLAYKLFGRLVYSVASLGYWLKDQLR